MPMFTDKTGPVAAYYGVYGIWILKHAANLPKDKDCVSELIKMASFYETHREQYVLGIIFGLIDIVIHELNWEPLFSTYDEARLNYLAIPDEKDKK